MTDASNTAPDVDTIRPGRRSQTFVMTPEWVIVAGLSPQAQALYTLLLAHVNHSRGDGLAWPGMDVLADLLGFRTRKSVHRYVRELVTIGAVDVERRQHSMLRRNEYVVHEIAPEGYAGARSLAEFHAARKANRAAPTGTAVPLARGTAGDGATGTPVGQNQTNATTRTEPVEDAASGDDSVEDACAAGGQRASSPTDIDRARAKRKPIKIRPPRGWLTDGSLTAGEIQRSLLACSIAALSRAGFEITDDGRQKLLDGISGILWTVDRRTLVERVQITLECVGTDDPIWGQIATKRTRRRAS